MKLEVSLESHPRAFVELDVAAVPAVGDYVVTAEDAFIGYVKRRRWEFDKDGAIVVRVWLHSSP